HPPYTKGSHDSDKRSDSDGRMAQMRENILPILEAGGVDLVLTGHSHGYERSFLLDGHYGTSTNLVASMIKDRRDGRPDGDGAYTKSGGLRPHEGAVYIVSGSAGQASGGKLDHPAMYLSLNKLGSLVIDIDGPVAEVKFIGSKGQVRDYFSLRKQ
ncbi:MAG: metallophosphoesterase, partial [Verrucomicrobiota bacterium]